MAIGKKVSPARFIGAALGIAGGVMNLVGGDKAGKAARYEQGLARKQMALKIEPI